METEGEREKILFLCLFRIRFPFPLILELILALHLLLFELSLICILNDRVRISTIRDELTWRTQVRAAMICSCGPLAHPRQQNNLLSASSIEACQCELNTKSISFEENRNLQTFASRTIRFAN